MKIHPYKILFILSTLICLLVLSTSGMSFSNPYFYNTESSSWRWQCYGQDKIDFFLIAPTLIITAFLLQKKNAIGAYVWPGVIIYLIYTYIIYCFDVHFNKFFIAYYVILGLSVYSLLYYFYQRLREWKISVCYSTRITKFTGVYFILLAVVFYALWLSEIVPAICQQTIPKTLTDAGLVTNPVHILDLSVVLPFIFTTGVLLLQRKEIGFLFAAPLLLFSALMDITIAVLSILTPLPITPGALVLFIVMTSLALFSVILLVLYIRNTQKTYHN